MKRSPLGWLVSRSTLAPLDHENESAPRSPNKWRETLQAGKTASCRRASLFVESLRHQSHCHDVPISPGTPWRMRQDCFVSILRDPVVDRLSYVGNHIFILMSLSCRHLQDLGFLVSEPKVVDKGLIINHAKLTRFIWISAFSLELCETSLQKVRIKICPIESLLFQTYDFKKSYIQYPSISYNINCRISNNS